MFPRIRRARPFAQACATALLATALGMATRAGAAPAEPAQIAVIAGDAVVAARFDGDALGAIFRRRIMLDAAGRPYIPVNLPPAHPLRRMFSEALFAMQPEDMDAYWNEQYFQGISPPYVVASIDAMVRFVTATPGAIGYVLDCQVATSVTVVLRLPVPAAFRSAAAALCAGSAAAR